MISSIITNGTLINKHVIDNLKKYNCKTIQITLDGKKNIHDSRRMYKNNQGSFDDVIKGIKLIQETKEIPNPVIRINIDKTNINEVYSLLEFLQQEKLTNCRLDFGVVRGGTEACSSYSNNCYNEDELGDVLEDLWTEAKKIGFNINVNPIRKFIFCGLNGDNSYTIAPTGDIYKCWEQVGMEEHIIGKLSNKGNIEDFQYTFYDWMSKNPLEVKECRDCVYLPLCGGGCGAISYEQTASYHSKGCFKTKGVIKNQIKLIYKEKILNSKGVV